MSIRSIVSSPLFLGAWTLAGVPAAAAMCHDVALAVTTTGAAVPALNMAVTTLAPATSLFVLRALGAATTPPAGTNLAPAPGQNLGGAR